jgi:hypothetical protein
VRDNEYWVEISQQGKRLGAGFILNRNYILSASHCLSGIESDDEPLELSFATGEKTPGQVCERAMGADLVLIDILKPRDSTHRLPNADRAGRGDPWFAPYRPSTSDPHLSGDVLSGPIAYRCEAGDEIEALQLGCSQTLGDYAGYSGGPVERAVTGSEPVLLGILLEQYPDRQATGRFSDVLFAATIAEALRSFNSLDVGRLLKVLYSADRTLEPIAGTASLPLEPRIAKAGSLLSALHEWGTGGVLDPMTVSMLKLQVAQRLVDGTLADTA